ncbi:MAG: hypothetical protein MJ106_05245, partial [Lentisphaeria bacterium]|nr:hypothetical protein [Lentisphaeria bacterium]
MRHQFLAIATAAVCVTLANANPLDLRSYEQKFSMTFATSEEAQAAEVTMLPLPEGYELAFSARWDDTNPKHLRTHKVMKDNDIKGTFFELNPIYLTKAELAKYYSVLLDGGCSLGIHSMTHPFMHLRDANTIFWEYMRCRVLVETLSQTQATTTVLPNSRWKNSADDYTARNVGRSIQAAGIIGSPDVFLTRGEKELGLPEGSLAMGFLLTPGDVNPNYDLAQTQLKRSLENPALKDNPEISMSMHSNHTDEGLVSLDRIFASMAHNPKWWYCNQNEYAAYRYEFRHDTVRKSVEGNTATFVVTRVTAFELGASVPLSFSLEGATPTAVDGIEKAGDFYNLSHAADFGCPSVFGLAGKDGTCEMIPNVMAHLTHSDKFAWTLTMNNSGAALENVDVTFRFGPAWEKPTLHCHQDKIAEGETVFNVTQEGCLDGEQYKCGAPYYAAQIDFVQDGVRKRLYAELQEEAAPIVRSACPRDTARAWEATNVEDCAKLSVAGATLPDKPEQMVFRDSYRPDVMMIAKNDPSPRQCVTAYVLDFKTLHGETKARLCFSVVNEVWLNGKKLDLNRKDSIETELQPGVNR